MEVSVLQRVQCSENSKTLVYLVNSEPFDKSQVNQIRRVERTLDRKGMEMDSLPLDCLGDSIAFHLIDRDRNLRGSYLLTQQDINRLFVELDIVLLQDNYGREVSR